MIYLTFVYIQYMYLLNQICLISYNLRYLFLTPKDAEFLKKNLTNLENFLRLFLEPFASTI